ncbi:MAG: hypothetical protein P1U67_08215 [Alcanivoracaceae bacterium]|nr:hypothetical protein [Alcanivoracaceae bacterium]
MNKSEQISSKGDHGHNAPPVAQQGQVKASSTQQGDNAGKTNPVKQPSQPQQQQDSKTQQDAGKKQASGQEQKKS